MPRTYKNTRKRRFDTRMTFRELCRAIGVRPKQRIMIIRYMKENRKEREQ